MIGTDPTKHCGTNAWPADFNDDGRINGQDLGMFAPHFGVSSADPRYGVRFDLNMDGKINGQDLGKLAPVFFKTCVP